MRFIFTELQSMYETLLKMGASEKRMQLFEKINEFIERGDFTKYKRFDLLKTVKNADLETQALTLGVTETNLRTLRSRITQEAVSAIGRDTFDVLLHGSERDVALALSKFEFGVAEGNCGTLFTTQFNAIMKGIVVDTEAKFNVADCKPELALLYWLSVKRLPNLLSEVDPERLKFLMKCIDSKAGTVDERAKIMRILLEDDIFSKLPEADRETFKFPPTRKEEDF